MVIDMSIVSNIKTLQGIDDDLQDDSLLIIVESIKQHLLLKLKRANKSIEAVPESLSFIVQEISIRRFVRIGSEGLKSDSVEGHAITFYELDDYFKPYQEIIDDFKEDDFSGNRGKVMFI